MPLTRGEAIGYDAHLMTFKFTMRNGEQIVQCQISSAALGHFAGGRRNSARDLPTEFEAHRDLIEAIASEQFDQTSNKETKPVSIFATDVKMPERRHFIVSAEFPVNQGLVISEECNSAADNSKERS